MVQKFEFMNERRTQKKRKKNPHPMLQIHGCRKKKATITYR